MKNLISGTGLTDELGDKVVYSQSVNAINFDIIILTWNWIITKF